MDAEKLTESIVDAIQEKQGKDIVVMDLRQIPNAITQYFVICQGNSPAQLDAIMDSIEETTLKELNDKPWHREGRENMEWLLLDYVDVVVHIFREEKRRFYNLEGLWADVPVKYIKTTNEDAEF